MHACIFRYTHVHVYIHASLSVLRILELKHEMFNLEVLEFHYFDDILTDMKLTPVSICTSTLFVFPPSPQ